MRITNKIVNNNMLRNLNQNMRRLDEVNQQLASGKKVSFPSDDPIAAGSIMRLRSSLHENEQYLRNVKQGVSWLHATDSVLQDATDMMHRAREQTVYGASGTLDETDRKALADEVGQLFDNMVQLGNSTHGGKQLFSGQRTRETTFEEKDLDGVVESIQSLNTAIEGMEDDFPDLSDELQSRLEGQLEEHGLIEPGETAADFESANQEADAVSAFLADLPGVILEARDDGLETDERDALDELLREQPIHFFGYGNTFVSYHGGMEDNETAYLTREIGVNVNIPLNVLGNDAFGDVFEVMAKAYHYLDDGNAEGLSSDVLGEFDDAMDNLLGYCSEVGAKTNRLELAEQRLSDLKVNLTALFSDSHDVDVAEAIMHLKNEENTYRTALSVGARIIQPSLVDFLR